MATLKNRRRERFAIEIAAMTPLAKAYAEAGFKASPWAPYNASKLMHDPAVAARIEELRDAIGDRAKIHAEYIQRKLLPLVEANPQDLFEAGTNSAGQQCDALRRITELPRELASAIQKIKCDPETGAVTEISLYNKTEAGNVLLRSVGAVTEGATNVQINRIERVIIEPSNHGDSAKVLENAEAAIESSIPQLKMGPRF
jgi:hypothetical protein